MNKPTVSIILCTFNGARYIREQLDSIVGQTYPLLEVIVQDDGSTDDTVAICEDYARRFPYVKVTRNAHNLGFNLNFKSAAMRAKGDFVAISDQDDVWMKDKIEVLVGHIGPHDICFSTHLRGRTPSQSHVVSPQYSLEALLFGGFAGHTMLLRRDFIQTDEYWIDHIHYDWSLAICAQLHRGIVMVDRPLNWHRQHELSACAVENQTLGGGTGAGKATWQPYLYGWRNYHGLQRKPNWRTLYQYIYAHTTAPEYRLAHTMSRCLLSGSPFALLRLCWLCMKHRRSVYYDKHVHGFKGLVRGFFYPFIFAYGNVQYDLK